MAKLKSIDELEKQLEQRLKNREEGVVWNNRKQRKHADKWNALNPERRAVQSQINGLIFRGELKKPTTCPKCGDKDVPSRKMYLNLDENNQWHGFHCSFCKSTEIITENQKRLLAGVK